VIGEKIQEILNAKGLTQVDLAEMVGMSGTQINRICKGHGIPNGKNIDKIAKALDVPAHALYSEEDAYSSVLALKILEQLPEDIVKAIGNKNNLNYLIMGLNLSDSELSPEEIKMVVRKQEELIKEIKEGK